MNRSRKDIEISEPTIFTDGSNRFMNMVNPELERVDVHAGKGMFAAYHGFKQNGVQIDPHNPPANVFIHCPADEIDLYFKHSHIAYDKARLPAFIKIKQALKMRGGSDGMKAWTLLVDVTQGSSPTMTRQELTPLYSAAAGDNITYLAGLITLLGPLLPDGWGWDEIRDWINSKDRDALLGRETEVLEVIT